MEATMDRYNSEGYADPTAAEAIANVDCGLNKVKSMKGQVSLNEADGNHVDRGPHGAGKVDSTNRKIIYVASPYAGDVETNTNRAKRYCRFVIGKGFVPFAGHLLFPQFLDDSDKDERVLGLEFALMLLSKCDELWVFGLNISDGMIGEIEKAKKLGIPVRYFDGKCEVI